MQSIRRFSRDAEQGVQRLQQAVAEPMVRLSVSAMACDVRARVPRRLYQSGQAADILQQVHALEQQMTVYRDDSEISQINKRAALQPIQVEPKLYELFERCRGWHQSSEAAFDITSGPLIRCWGFRHRKGEHPDPDDLQQARRKVGMHHVRFDRRERTLAFDQLGIELNLGAVGKGYALDRLAESYRRCGLRSILLDAGRSSVRAVGRPPWADAWRLDIGHPLFGEHSIATVWARDAGLSTSGIADQFFVKDGVRYGHILDPRTGLPVSGMLQVTALADSATEAEALSTAFFVNGLEWTTRFCERHRAVGAIVIPDPGPGKIPVPVVVGQINAQILESDQS